MASARDPASGLIQIMKGITKTTYPYAARPKTVLIVTQADPTGGTVQAREPAAPYATGMNYRFFGTAPVVGNRILVDNSPTGPYVERIL